MTEYELEQRLRAWYRDEIGYTEPAPELLRDGLTEITVTYRPGPFSSRRSLVLLAAAVLLLVASIGAAIILSQPTPFPQPGPGPSVQNGVISFGQLGESGGFELMEVNSDGSGIRAIPGVTVQGDLAWAPDGSRAAFVDESGLVVMNADGSGREIVAESPDGYGDVAWSPDGTQIAFAEFGGEGWNIHVMNADGTGIEEPWPIGPSLIFLEWSPDGSQFLFGRELSVGDRFETALHVVNADGSEERALTDSAEIVSYAVWSPDGSQIAFSRRPHPANGLPSSYNPPWDIWIMAADGSNQRPLAADPDWSELHPAWSPDGSLIAFAGNAADGFGLYVMNDDGTEVRRIVGPVDTIGFPSWAAAVEGAD
ncbi:MAG TPA: hypothetical protein VJ839_00990 [Candidatus Limnocylindria bacterium]|nr:hypothetical protein [Candidatus Limnocylindria bacterium]